MIKALISIVSGVLLAVMIACGGGSSDEEDLVPMCQLDAECDNGSVCDGSETCNISTQQCVAGTPLNCDDGNPCTADTCDGVGGCSSVVIDADNDSYGPGAACGGDCDDNDAARHPGAVEACDGIDNNCDNVVDENAPYWWVDCDCDGYAAAGAGFFRQCSEPPFPPSEECTCWSPVDPATSEDFDDGNSDVHPDQEDFFIIGYGVSGDLFDYNCDGIVEKRYGLVAAAYTWDEGLGICLGSGYVGVVAECGVGGYFRPALKEDSKCTTECACRWGDSYNHQQDCR